MLRHAAPAHLAISAAIGQTQFDVVSVKPNTSGDRAVRIGSPSPGRFHAENVWLRFLVQTAWNVKDFQVSGGPAWAASDRFNIDATTDAKVPFDQMRLMLQKLLEDRFQLTLHRESKEFPVYELVVAKGGSNLPLSKEGSCVPRDAAPQPPAPGQPPPNYCGIASWSPRSLSGNGISTQQLTATLANIFERPVIDKTGLTAAFDANLEWTADRTTPGLMAPDLPLPAEPSAADSGPTIFTVLQEQLGLKLQAAKGPVEVLLIDRAEKPSAN
jgi:uncharacterized protein (TIGR03435 family)